MDSGGHSPTPSPERKRRRMDWRQWELSPMRDLVERGDGLDIVADRVADAPTLHEEVMREIERLQEQYPNWTQVPEFVRDAIIFLDTAAKLIGAEWKSSLAKVRLITAIFMGDLRAHEAGAYQKIQGVWTKCDGFTTDMIKRLEDGTKAALVLLMKGGPSFDDAMQENSLPALLQDIIQNTDFAAESQAVLQDVDKALSSRGAQEVGWAKVTLGRLANLLPFWSRCGDGVFKDYCRWAFTPRPPLNGLLAFDDCVLDFSGDHISQIMKANAQDCYSLIPVCLAYKPPDSFVDWFRKFFVTTMAGDMDGMELEFAVECLAKRGMRLPHHQVIYFGDGGNSKGARSKLRARAYGTSHQFVSTAVFDKNKDDEFRKQGPEFHGARLCTLQEADAFDVDEKTWRLWTGGDNIRCRLPHATHTPELNWETTGKFWELNPKNPPKFPSITEHCNRRRIRAIEKVAHFTTNEDQVDCGKLLFEADRDLEDKLDTGDAVWCYFRLFLFPWEQTHSPAMAKEIIMNPRVGIRNATDKLFAIFEGRHIPQGGSAGPSESASAGVDNIVSPQFTMLKQCHTEWKGAASVKDYRVWQAHWILGGSKNSQRSGTRLEVFHAALDRPDNFFFDRIAEDVYAVAPFDSIDDLLTLPSHVFGTPQDWLPFSGNSGFKKGDAGDSDTAMPIEASDIEEDDVSIATHEIGNVPALREYLARDIDRRPAVLRQWIDDLVDGSPMGDGWYEVEIPHHLPHGLPGRHIPLPRASLAKLTKEARTVSVEGRCREADKPLSHLTILLALADKYGFGDEVPMIRLFVNNAQEWRDRWGKRPLTSLMYGGVPQGNAWNPITWTVFAQIRTVAIKILALPDFAHLQGMFRDRRNPLYSRLYYALSAEEACEVLEAMKTIEDRGGKVWGMIYDSLLVEMEGPLPLEGLNLVEKKLPRWQDNFFMVIRDSAQKTTLRVQKQAAGKHMCICSSLLNVGGRRVKRAIVSLIHDGPHSYLTVQQHLLARRANQYMQPVSVEDVGAAPSGQAFLLHCDGHCAGIEVANDGMVDIFDDSYDTVASIGQHDLTYHIQNFKDSHPHAVIICMKLQSGNFAQSMLTPDLHAVAGGGRRI